MKLGISPFIAQNIIPSDVKGITIFDSDGNKVCDVDVSKMKPQNLGDKKYSVGLLSDTHTSPTSGSDSVVDLTNAISYLSTVAEMTCVCGDLCNVNDDGGLEKHKEIVDANKGSMKVFEIAGNHEHYASVDNSYASWDDEQIKQYTNYPLYYTVSDQATDETNRNYYCETLGENDVFIMCGNTGWTSAFNSKSMQWLYETLEANRNKRCLLFVHPFLNAPVYCGDSLDVLTWDGLSTYRDVFIALLKHYKNVIYFHGHSHAMCQMQEYLKKLANPLPANYDFTNGTHSIHIPSLAVPRDVSSGSRVDVSAASQGYLMDVYENHIILRGRDFVADKFLPIATYCLDTTLQTIEAGTFTDPTGTIETEEV